MLRPLASVAALALAFIAAACGGDSNAPDNSGTVTILDEQVTLTGAGTACDAGGVDADFTGQAGKTVIIEASGSSSLTPGFTLYAPDFSTQLGGSNPNGAGKAKLTIALTEAGVYHITLCEATGKAGTLRVTVKQQSVIG